MYSSKKFNPSKHNTPEQPTKQKPEIPKKNELTICGWNACWSQFKNRPEDILRLYFSQERGPELKEVARWCAKRKYPYRQLDAESLNKVSASLHHEGVAMTIRPPQLPVVRELIKKGIPADSISLTLDRIGNPHNFGAILRSAAYFGTKNIVLSEAQNQATVSSSVARMAEGALPLVSIYKCSDLPSALRDMQTVGVFVLGADVKSGNSLFEEQIKFPCMLVLGNEKDGLSDKVKKRCNKLIKIPGAGELESLNVSVAAGTILSEIYRRRSIDHKA